MKAVVTKAPVAVTEVLVKAVEPHRRILIEWDGYSRHTTPGTPA